MYYFLDWRKEPFLAGVYSVGILLGNFPLWYLLIAISRVKDSYWVEREAVIREEKIIRAPERERRLGKKWMKEIDFW